jgi:hypothetical protein
MTQWFGLFCLAGLAGGFSGFPSPDSSAEIYRPAVLAGSAELLSLAGLGQGQGAILRAGTSEIVSPDNPAAAGEVLEIYYRLDRWLGDSCASNHRRPYGRGSVVWQGSRLRLEPGERPSAGRRCARNGRPGAFDLPQPPEE